MKENQEHFKTEIAHKTYETLANTIKTWQEEHASALSDWQHRVHPPYFTFKSLPDNLVLDLWQRLNESLGVLSLVDDLAQELTKFKENGELSNQEKVTSLYFALSGVAQLARKQISEKLLHYTVENWADSTCPVCGEESRLTLLVPPVGKRYLYCRMCGHEWPGKRVGCVVCGSENASKQTYLKSEEFPDVEIAACEECGEYFKEIDLRTRKVELFLWEDVQTLPLNYAAEQWLSEQAQKKGSIH